MEISYQVCDDPNFIWELHTSYFKENNDSFLFNLKTKPYYKIFTATQKGVLIAYCIITEIAGEAEIINIATKMEFTNLGIAKSLLKFVINSTWCNSLFLEVSDNNLPAIKLYQSCGFTKIGLRKNYYGDSDAILMEFQK